MEINQYSLEFQASDVEREISNLCEFLVSVKMDTNLLISEQARAAIYQLSDLLALYSNLLIIDHYRQNRGDLLLRRAHEKDCEDCEFVCFNGVYFKVVLYL